MTSSLNDLDNKVVVLDSAILPDSEECLIEEELLKPMLSYLKFLSVQIRKSLKLVEKLTPLFYGIMPILPKKSWKNLNVVK